VLRTAGQSLLAGVLMGVVVYAVATVLLARLGVEGLVPRLVVVVVPAAVGGVFYYVLLRLMHVPETALIDRLVGRLARR
jgi:hypothetical protein